jgi:tetratricopeptide (TPR) repeat protein
LEEISTNKLSPFNKSEDKYILVWAKIKGTLTSIYMQKNSSEDLQKALDYAKESLTILTPETHFPVWSVVVSHKAVVEKKLKLFDDSLKTYDLLLKYRSKESNSDSWALVQTNMGNLYSDEEFKSKNFNKAIQCYKNALSVFTKEDDVIKWSVTMVSLGYSLLLIDDKNKSNLMESLKCLNEAIGVIDKNFRKHEWYILRLFITGQWHIFTNQDVCFNCFTLKMKRNFYWKQKVQLS